jgi:hypothetical protein
MKADEAINHDPSGEASTILLTGDQLEAARRKLTSAAIRRWALQSSVGSWFDIDRDLDDPMLSYFWRLAI